MPEKIRKRRSLAAAGGTALGGPARQPLRIRRQVREHLVRILRVHLRSFTVNVAPAVSCGGEVFPELTKVLPPMSRYAQMRRCPACWLVTFPLNWNGPGLTNESIKWLVYLRANSAEEVAAHRVDDFCENTRTSWRGPSDVPLTFSAKEWPTRIVVGFTVTIRLEAEAGTAKTSRPTVTSKPTSGRRLA
jgi:hypothetical protein